MWSMISEHGGTVGGASMRVERRPLRSAVIVGALSLAGALSASMVAIVDGLEHPRPPIRASDRVIDVRFRLEGGHAPGVQFLPEFANRRAELTRILSDPSRIDIATQVGVGGFFSKERAELTGVEVVGVDTTFFDLVGILPAVGTSLLPSDERWSSDDPEAGPLPVVLGWKLAYRIFGDAEKALGAHELAGRPVFVRGVFPDGVKFPGETNVWAPVSRSRAQVPGLIRLKPGVELPAVALRAPELELRPVTVAADRSRANLPRLLLAVSVLLIVLALVQCAALLSAELLERSTEFRIRMALGGTWARVAGPLVARVVVLCVVAAAFVALTTPLTTIWLVDALPRDVVRGQYLEPGLRTLQLGLLLAVTAITILSALPLATLRALAAEGSNVSFRQAATTPHLRGRAVLLMIQVALTSTLVYVAAVAWIGVTHFWQFDYGFKPEEVLTFRQPLVHLSGNPNTVMDEIRREQAMVGQSIADVEHMPGVLAAAGMFSAPFGAGMSAEPVDITFQGRPRPDLPVRANVVGPDFIRALGARVLAGRDPAAPDLRGEQGSIVINKTLARRLLRPGADDLESHLLIGTRLSSHWESGRVVAIIDDLVQRSPDQLVDPEFYSIHPRPDGFARVLIRTDRTSLPAVRAVLEKTWGPLRPENLRWMADELTPLAEPYTSQARLMTLVLLGAVPIVALGVFGAASLFLRSREHEIATRIALGADAGDIRWLVFRPGLLLAGTGSLAGIVFGMLVCRTMSIRLFGVDAVNFGSVSVSVLFVLALTGLAGASPLRRAVRTDPAALFKQGVS